MVSSSGFAPLTLTKHKLFVFEQKQKQVLSVLV